MRSRLTVVVVVIGVCLIAVALPTAARNGGSPTPSDTHPLIGAWDVSIVIEMDGSPEALFLFHSDGTVIATDDQGRTWYGAWSQTGANTAKYVLVKSGPAATSATFFGTADVDSSGNTWNRSSALTHGADDIKGTRISTE